MQIEKFSPHSNAQSALFVEMTIFCLRRVSRRGPCDAKHHYYSDY